MVIFLDDIHLGMHLYGNEVRFDFIKNYRHIEGYYLFGVSSDGLRKIADVKNHVLILDLKKGRLIITGVDDVDGNS